MVMCALVWYGVQVIMASEFSLLGRIGIPNNNIYILEWNGCRHGVWASYTWRGCKAEQ